MQKKLLIYETTHYETLPALLELAIEQFDQITIYAASQDTYESCNHFPVFQQAKIKWFNQSKDQGNREFIKQLFHEMISGNYSHFLINSLDHNLLYFSLKLSGIEKKIHTVLTVHVIHDYTTARYNSLVNISESIAKKKLHRLIKNYRVLAPSMPAYMKSRLKKIEVEYIPGMFYQAFPETDFTQSPFRIVVPGNVEEKRREYESIPQVIKLMTGKLEKYHPIELVILGNNNNPYGKALEKNIRAALPPYISLIVFDRDVTFNTYSSYYSSAHIIWAPVRLHMESIRKVPEITGLSISAGLIVDFIHYARPTLVPSPIKFDQQLDPLFFRYAGPEDAAHQLLAFVNDPRLLQQRQTETRTICSAYTAQKFRTVFKQLMNL